MTVSEGREVSIEYTLKLDSGEVVDSNADREPLTYTQGSGQLLPALEEALEGMKAGDSKEVALTPDEGYGQRNPEMRQEVPLEQIPENARHAGTTLVATDNSGNRHQVQVAEITEEKAVLDLNHPLAGKSLHFDVTVVAVD